MLAGMGLAVLAIAMVVIQYSFQILVVPWYLPLVTAIGALLVLWSLTKRLTIVRMVVLVLLAALAGLEWASFAVGGKLPEYTGPAEAGKKLPAFQTTLADGRSFTQNDLEDGQRRVLTFFRGRW
jgi:hypothetical protein